MIPQAAIVAWRAAAPWADDALVEQDLVLSRGLVEIFAEPVLAEGLAFRGGTALHKLVLAPASRYSEDLDLVQVARGPIGPLLDAIRHRLDPWLGNPTRDQAEATVTLIYRFTSEIPPVRPLRLKVEINTREHIAVHGHVHRPAVHDRVALVLRTGGDSDVHGGGTSGHQAPGALPTPPGPGSLRSVGRLARNRG